MIKAIGERIIVRKDNRGPTNIGGILIPESLERTPRFSPTVFGEVIAAGSRCQTVRKGMRVAIKNHAGDDMLVGEETLTLMREKDIIGIVS